MKYYLPILLVFAYFSAGAQKWEKKSDFPSAGRDGAIILTIGNKCYFGGGEADKSFWQYDPATDQWTRKSDLPGVTTTRSFGLGFTIGSKGYVGTGDDGAKLKKDIWEYDADSDKWTQKADFPVGRNALSCFVLNGKAYVGGGTDNNYIYSAFYSYDPVADKWDSLGQLPTGYTAFAAAFAIGSKGYFQGGAGASEYSTLYEYDPSTNKWTQKSGFPGAARQAAAGFSINGKGYVGLGQSSYTTVYKDFYEYDPVADKWTQIADFTYGGLAWPSATVLNGRAFIGGGWDFGASYAHEWYEFIADTTTGIETAQHAMGNINCWYKTDDRSVSIKAGKEIHGPGEFKLYDMSGKVILAQSINIQSGTPFSVPCQLIPSGIYILNISCGSNFYSGKLVTML